MDCLVERKKKSALRRETAAWQRAAAGLFALSVVVNVALTGRIIRQEKQMEADAAQYQAEIEKAEHIRDMAVQKLGEVSIAYEQEKNANDAYTVSAEAVDERIDTPEYKYMGEFKITAYCPCELCCGEWSDGVTATGIPAEPGVVAVDPAVIPLGSVVVINGQEYLAADVGGGVKGNHVDICFLDHETTVQFGVQTAEVWVVAE